MVQEVRRQSAELIHGHWSSTIGAACAEAAQQLDIPLIAEVRFDLAGAVNAQSFSGLARPLEPLARRWFERHLKHAQVIVSASDALAQLLTRLVPKASSCIYSVPNGIGAEFLARCDQARRESSTHDDRSGVDANRTTPVVIGTTSKMLRYENIDALLDLLKSIPDTQLLLVGDGPERKRLEARVATAVGDTAQLLQDGRGRLVPAGDPLALEHAVRELAEDANARTIIGRRARTYAASALNGDALLQRYATIYRTAQQALA